MILSDLSLQNVGWFFPKWFKYTWLPSNQSKFLKLGVNIHLAMLSDYINYYQNCKSNVGFVVAPVMCISMSFITGIGGNKF